MGKRKNEADQLTDLRDQGFYIVDDEIIDDYGSRIGPLGVAVYNVLTKHANKFGSSCFPSYQTIADKLGISRPVAIKGVKKLIEVNLVRKSARMDEDGSPTSNDYKILPVPKRKKADSTPDLSDAGSKDSLLGGKESLLPLVNNIDHPSKESLPEPDPSNQTPLNQTHTHGARAPAAGGVGVSKSRFSYEERKRYGENNVDFAGRTLGKGWLKTSADGSCDELIEDWYRRQKAEASGQPIRDISLCPDCHGQGFFYPTGSNNAVKKCEHSRLAEVIANEERQFNEAQEVLSRAI